MIPINTKRLSVKYDLVLTSLAVTHIDYNNQTFYIEMFDFDNKKICGSPPVKIDEIHSGGHCFAGPSYWSHLEI